MGGHKITCYSSLSLNPNNKQKTNFKDKREVKIEGYNLDISNELKKKLGLTKYGKNSLSDVVDNILGKGLHDKSICILCNGAKSISVEDNDLASSIIKCPICNK